ncbi:MAG: BRO family protein [Plesiomonas sp.]|uniref:BRO family protein n=1 Tax=Plesiomonas sp. TaxID=2486279 RepID=UPI003F2CA611
MTNNKLSLFKFHTSSVRTIQLPHDTNIWFIAKDVTDALGIKRGYDSVNKTVDEEDRQKVKVYDCTICDPANSDISSNGVRKVESVHGKSRITIKDHLNGHTH